MQNPDTENKYTKVDFNGRTFQNTPFNEEKQMRQCEWDRSHIGSLAEADAVQQAVGNESLCEGSSCLGTIKHMVPAIKHGAGKCKKIPLNQEERCLP